MSEMAPIRLVNLGLTGAVRSQAVYHAVAQLANEATADTIILARPESPYLCIGYHQALADVLDEAACRRLNLPIVRRSVGGGTTYLDRNQQFYQFIFHQNRVPATPDAMYRYFLEVPVAVLRNLGFDARLKGAQELEIDGRRAAGIGGGLIGDSAVVVGNFIFDFDYAAMTEVWQAPWPAFRELAGRALKDQIGTLWNLRRSLTIEAVVAAFEEAAGPVLNRVIVTGALTPDEEDLARRLAETMTARDYLTEIPGISGEAKPPLKIAAGLMIHAETGRAGAEDYRGAFKVRDGVIEEAVLERAQGIDWVVVEQPLAGVALPDWRNGLEPVHA